MIRKIDTIKDVKAELQRYFETMRALPMPQRPSLAKNYMWSVMEVEETEAKTEQEERCQPLPVDIADCWVVDTYYMAKLSKFEYQILAARCKERPLPWKLLVRKYNLTRQMLNIYYDKALKKVFHDMKNGVKQ